MDSKLAQYGGRIFSEALLLGVLFLQWIAQANAAPFAYTVGLPSGFTTAKTMSVIDTATNSVVDTISVGLGSSDIAVNPAGTRVYVGMSEISGNTISLNLLVIETASNTTLAKIPLGAVTICGVPAFFVAQDARVGVAANPQGGLVYVATFFPGGQTSSCGWASISNVSVIDTITNSVVATLPVVGDGLRHVAVNPTGTRVYVTNEFNNTVSVIDTTTNLLVGTIGVDRPSGIALNPAGTRAYVGRSESDTNTASVKLSVIDTSNNAVVNTIPIASVTNCAIGLGFGCSPFKQRVGIAVHPSRNLLYVTIDLPPTVNSSAVTAVSVVNTETNTVESVVPVTGFPQGVAVHPAGSTVYVAGGLCR